MAGSHAEVTALSFTVCFRAIADPDRHHAQNEVNTHGHEKGGRGRLRELARVCHGTSVSSTIIGLLKLGPNYGHLLFVIFASPPDSIQGEFRDPHGHLVTLRFPFLQPAEQVNCSSK